MKLLGKTLIFKLKEKSQLGSLLLLLSCFSCVRPSATPWTAAHQAPPSMGFSRQEYWSGVPLPSPIRKFNLSQISHLIFLIIEDLALGSLQRPSVPCPMDCSLPGSSIHGIFQARVLEWGAVAFSERTGMRTRRSAVGFLRSKGE